MERLSFLYERKVYTKRYEEHIYHLCKENTIQFISKFEKLGYDAIEGIYYRAVNRNIKKYNASNPIRILGIDEIAQKKGHNHYIVIISDIERGCVLDVLPDRKKETLKKFFKNLDAKLKSTIEYVSTDMCNTYRRAIEEELSDVKLVADRFHVMKSVNECLDYCRRTMKKSLKDEFADRLKGSKYALLKNEKDLTEKQQKKLQEVYQTCEKLKVAHNFKESFRNIFEVNKDKDIARTLLDTWIENVSKSSVRTYFKKILTTLSNWKEQILNYFEERITNGFVEGINNKIKLIKRRAYGYENFEHFKMRIMDAFT